MELNFFWPLLITCPGKDVQTRVCQLCDSCQILDLINFQNDLNWPNSTLLKSVWILGWNTVKFLTGMKKLSIHLAPILKNVPFIWIACVCVCACVRACVRACVCVCVCVSCTGCFTLFSPCCTLAHERRAGRFDCLMSSLLLMSMDCGWGHCGSPDPTHRGIGNWIVCAIKQIKYML